MAKSPAVADKPVESAGSEPLTLTEFCIRLSKRVKRVELIGAFEFVEKAAGHVRDTEEAFQGRFDAFIKQPA
ncbi:hypothetical protein FHR70_000750 [Microvirga lupini]|uniref:Uncharacterized protein n=1 Tax=Microvirga lupini TaxID=420324 RepID=A0A7W4VI87_9HYPH|nr:hypothetical protein [Microvirga lupini]MBB3017710.1 hypothetical protein [Microvirga lupini]